MDTKIYHLVFCHTCHKPIRKNEFIEWEESIYCEPCFDRYLDLVEPRERANNVKNDNRVLPTVIHSFKKE